jgi:hypothetical protein
VRTSLAKASALVGGLSTQHSAEHDNNRRRENKIEHCRNDNNKHDVWGIEYKWYVLYQKNSRQPQDADSHVEIAVATAESSLADEQNSRDCGSKRWYEKKKTDSTLHHALTI